MKLIQPITSTKIRKYANGVHIEEADLIAVEEPLQIKLQWEQKDVWQEKALSITMRTPGEDFDLAMGFLWAESIIQHPSDVLLMRYCKRVKDDERGNVMLIRLANGHEIPASVWERNFLTNSSCGICGKSAIAAVHCGDEGLKDTSSPMVSAETLNQLVSTISEHQAGFNCTGGLHAAALFDLSGKLLLIREDVGRHNALDKLVGAALNLQLTVEQAPIILLSGRVSYEMVQKTVRASVPILVAVGAPSSLAIGLAREKGITLVGFLRNQRFNAYTHTERIYNGNK